MPRPALMLWILCAVVLAVYWPSFTGWNIFDDAHWIPEILTPVTIAPRWDLAHWSLSLNAWLGGTTPWGYHLLNVGIHCVNGGLVFVLASRLLKDPMAALLAAAVFLLHPIQTEAVAYLTGRWELVSTTGILIACVAPWPVAVVAAVLAMTTKTSAIVVLPLLWLVRESSEWTFLAAIGAGVVIADALWKDLVGKVPYLFMSPYSPIEYAARQAVALWRMLTLVIVPWGQTVDHDWIHVPIWAVAAAIPALLGAAVEIVRRRRVQPILWLAACWILICVAPRFVVRTPEFLSEHQVYLPFVGVALLVGSWGRS